jgi:BTB/POZ domain
MLLTAAATMREEQAIIHRIELKNIRLKTGQDLLYYLYNGRLSDDVSNLMDLLPLADQYELTGLKVMCLDRLDAEVTDDNYVELLRLAERCNAKKLKARVIEYIAANAGRLAM